MLYVLYFCCAVSHIASSEPQNNKKMLQPTINPTQFQTQLVIGKDDLAEIINGIVDAQMQRFFDRKKEEAKGDTFLTPKEVTELLDVNLSTLWRWHREGYLMKVYIGNKPRYRQSDIDRILKKGGEK